MKAVILAGGYGTRISEESSLRPKPMVEIGGKPILWHIMKTYAAHGITDFIICAGYKSFIIKEYFANYFVHNCDMTFRLASNEMVVHRNSSEDWSVTVVDTGENTMTGGRLKRVGHFLDDDFCFTYGDGVGDVNISELIRFHKQQGRLGTVTSVEPPARFGALVIENDRVVSFREKPIGEGWVSGGFFVLSPKVLDYVKNDHTIWEKEPLERLAAEGELSNYRHAGFWQPMDTIRDKTLLEQLWAEGRAPWKVWP